MNTVLHSLWLALIAIGVAVIGGIVEALTNFHPTDQIAQLLMTSVGGIVIGGLNVLLHKLQGTAVAPKSAIAPTP